MGKIIRGEPDRGRPLRCGPARGDHDRGDGGKKEIKFACNADVVVIDDLGNCRETEWADDVISLIISRRYNEKRSTIFTTNYFDDGTENDLSKKIGYRLRSRLYTMAYPVIIDGTDRRRMK